jgi:hypothetical protein
MPNKYQPEYAYLKHVRIKRIHLFTIIQLFSIIGLILVKSIEAIAILLPVMVYIILIIISSKLLIFISFL